MKINKILLLLIGLLFAGLLQAQTKKIEYRYDAAGNREWREVITISGKKNSAAYSSTVKIPIYSDWLDKMKITIYPNPTLGQLTIDIANIPTDAIGEITIHNTEGKAMKQIKKLNATNQLDLSAFPTGIYILSIASGPKTCEWKIVKE
jgi:hypothetical protein